MSASGAPVADDTRRANLEFFTGLRNRVEQRYGRDIASWSPAAPKHTS